MLVDEGREEVEVAGVENDEVAGNRRGAPDRVGGIPREAAAGCGAGGRGVRHALLMDGHTAGVVPATRSCGGERRSTPVAWQEKRRATGSGSGGRGAHQAASKTSATEAFCGVGSEVKA
jgi:hypothetical protein